MSVIKKKKRTVLVIKQRDCVEEKKREPSPLCGTREEKNLGPQVNTYECASIMDVCNTTTKRQIVIVVVATGISSM